MSGQSQCASRATAQPRSHGRRPAPPNTRSSGDGDRATAQNGAENLSSSLIGADFRLTIRPPDAGTRKDFTVRTEGYRLQRIGEDPTTTRYGMFADLSWRLDRRWIVGGRYDYVEAPFGPDDTTWRGTLVATWWQSEFVYLRLQAFRNHAESTGPLDNLTFQVVWALGPHKHETY